MSLALGLGFASLRVLLGLVGVGYSLLKADFGEGASVSNEFLKNIPAGTASNAVFELLKGGGTSALEETAKLLQQGDSLNLNHDLQRAARKAQLTATLLAVRACLAETKRLKTNKNPFWSKAFGFTRKDEDEKWLHEVAKLWRRKIDNLPNEVPPQNIEREQIADLFNPKADATPSEVQSRLVEKLKEDTLAEIRSERYSVSPLPEAAYKLLEEAVKVGWNEFADDAAYLTSLNLPKNLYRPERTRALINADKQYDWFSLVCGLFNEEYKTNERVEAAMQKYLLLDIRDRQSGAVLTKDGKPVAAEVFFGHLEQLGDSFARLEALLKTFDAKQDEILGLVKSFTEENRRLHVNTHEQLAYLIRLLEEEKDLSGEARETIHEVNRQAYQREIALEHMPSEVVGSLIERDRFFVDRDAEREDLKNRLLGGEKMIVIKAFSGYGKTSLMTEVLHSVAPGEQLQHEKVRGILLFYCRDKEQASLREVCRKTDARLRKANVESNFTQSYEAFKREARDSPNSLPTRLIDKLIHDLSTLGDIWLVFDNFETALDGATVKDAELRQFFVQALSKVSRLRFLATSQKSPQFDGIDRVGTLPIGDLPENFAKEFLRRKGAELKAEDIDCGLAEPEEAMLDELLSETTAVPMRLVSFVGYLREAYLKRGKVLTDALADRSVMADFRQHDAKKGSMRLIEKQYLLLNETERLILKALSIFQKAVPFAVLKSILPLTLNDDDILSCLVSSSLVRRIGSYYELLTLPKEVIVKQAEKSDEPFSRHEMHVRAADFYASIRKEKAEWKTIEDLAPHFEDMYHCIQAQLYDWAAGVLDGAAIGFLLRAGYSRRVIEEGEKLVGKPMSAQANVYVIGWLANAYTQLGEIRKALEYNILALNGLDLLEDRGDEGRLLGNIGICHAELGDNQKALDSYERALKLNREVGDKASEAVVLRNTGNVYGHLGELRKALDCYESALRISRAVGDRVDLGGVLSGIGNVYLSLGELPKAFEYFEEALEIHREVHNRVFEGRVLGNIGTAYVYQGEGKKALGYYEQALEISREIGDRVGEGKTLGYIGNAHSSLSENQKALECYKQALEINRKVGNRGDEGIVLGNIGNTHRRLGENQKALEYFEQALQIHRDVRDKTSEGIVLGNEGITRFLMGHKKEGIMLVAQALEIARLVDDKSSAEQWSKALVEIVKG